MIKDMLAQMSWPVAKSAIWTALFVGTVLCIINHGGKVFSGTLMYGDWLKMGLTYLVPFCVSTYSALKARVEQQS